MLITKLGKESVENELEEAMDAKCYSLSLPGSCLVRMYSNS